MKRVIVVAAALLASALSAHAAPVKKHLRVANRPECHATTITTGLQLPVALHQDSTGQWRISTECYPRGHWDPVSRHVL
jgi:hypothetical protein